MYVWKKKEPMKPDFLPFLLSMFYLSYVFICYFREYHYGEWITIDFDRIISSFKSDFWLQKHQWFVYGETDDETTILYTLPYCESSSLYLTTALPVDKNNRAQIKSPILPYTHKYKHTLQELTLCVNSDADSSSRLYRYYFSNVIKLCLNTEKRTAEHHRITI